MTILLAESARLIRRLKPGMRVETTFQPKYTGTVAVTAVDVTAPDYGPHDNAFSGEVHWVQIDLEGEDQDHLISPEERFQVAMARQ